MTTQLRGPDGGHVTARAGADDDEIEGAGVGHGRPLERGGGRRRRATSRSRPAAASGAPGRHRARAQGRRLLAGLLEDLLHVLHDLLLHLLRRIGLQRPVEVLQRRLALAHALVHDAQVEERDGLAGLAGQRQLEQLLRARRVPLVVVAHAHVHDRHDAGGIPGDGARVVRRGLGPVGGVVEDDWRTRWSPPRSWSPA